VKVFGLIFLFFELPQVFQVAVVTREKPTTVVLGGAERPGWVGSKEGEAQPPPCSFCWLLGRGWVVFPHHFLQMLTSYISSSAGSKALRLGEGRVPD
jgi:hypothetical protein